MKKTMTASRHCGGNSGSNYVANTSKEASGATHPNWQQQNNANAGM